MGVCEQLAPAATLTLVGLADCPRASSVSTKRMAADSASRDAQAQCYQTDYQTGALHEAALCLVPEARTQVRLLRPPIKPARALWVCAVLLPLLNYGLWSSRSRSLKHDGAPGASSTDPVRSSLPVDELRADAAQCEFHEHADVRVLPAQPAGRGVAALPL
jgi:hypothetical protein